MNSHGLPTVLAALAVAVAAANVLAPGAQAQQDLAPGVCVETSADASCDAAAVSLGGDASCGTSWCAGASGTGDAACEGGSGACVALSGTSNASCHAYICVVASGAGDAVPNCWSIGHCVAVSGTGDAGSVCPDLGACVAVSGTGNAEPYCETPFCASASGFGNSTGCVSVSLAGPSDGQCYRMDDGQYFLNSWSVSGTDRAKADWVAASGTGEAEADWVAVSGTGDATCHSGPHGPEGLACVAVSGTGEASGNQAQVSGCALGESLGTPGLCYDPGLDDDVDHAGDHVDRTAEAAVEDVEQLP